MGEIWAVLIHSLKDMKSNLALADSNGKVLNSSAERKPGPQRCNFFVQKITVTGVELKVPVTNVTIAIQWYHGLLHMDGEKTFLHHITENTSHPGTRLLQHTCVTSRELKYCSGLEWGICMGLGWRF